jgi:TonB-dependent receptor
MSKKVLLLSLMILHITLSFALDKGTIRGQVFDKNTGEAIIGALVGIEGSPIATTTDFYGNYTLQIEPGTYNLNISFISYETITIRDVQVSLNEVYIVDVQLGESNVSLNEVVITAKENHKSVNSLLTYRKNASGIVDGISADEISKFGDGNAASALKRVTGVTVEGGKYVYLRGLSGRYVVTTLNGSSFPALDPDEKNSVQMDLFPSNIIDNIIVRKTYMPDMPGDATGGLVDINTSDFPEKFTMHFSNSLSYNTQANLNKNFLTTETGKFDWLGMDGGQRTIPQNAQTLIDGMDERGTEIISFHPAGGSYGYTENELNAFTQAFNTNVYPVTKRSFLNHGHKLSIGNQIRLRKNRTLGFNMAFSYSHDYDYYDDGMHGLYKQETLDDDKEVSDRKGEEETKLAGLLNLNLKLNNNHIVSLRTFRNQTGVNYARYRIGTFNYESSGTFIQERAMGYIGRTVNLGQLEGKHSFEIGLPKQMTVNWSVSYASMNQNEPDARFFTNLFTNPDSETIDEMTDAEFKFKTNTTPNRIYTITEEYNLDSKMDVELPWEKMKVKFGVGYITKMRESDQQKIELANAGSTGYAGSFHLSGNLQEFIENNIITDDGTQNGLYYRMDAKNNALNSFGASNSVLASYFLIDRKVSSFFHVSTGLRYEYSDIYAFNKGDESKQGGFTINDFLPTLNLTLKLSDQMNLRLSGSQTVSRPIFEEIAPISIYKYKYGMAVSGNPDLKRSIIRNTDLRWEYYVRKGELIAFTAFYKNISNAIESTFDPSASNYEVIFFNSKEAQLYGFEIEAKKELFESLTFGGNFAYIRSVVFLETEELVYKDFRKRPMAGQAPYVINVYTSYSIPKIGFETTLAFNMSGEKLFLLSPGYTPYVYEMPKPDLNFNIGKKFGKRILMEFSIENILDSEYKAVQHGVSTDKYFLRYSTGRTYGMNLKYML